MSLNTDFQDLSVTGLITLYELDATSLGAGKLHLHGHNGFSDWSIPANSNPNLIDIDQAKFLNNRMDRNINAAFTDKRTLTVYEPDGHGAGATFDYIPVTKGQTFTLSFNNTNELSYYLSVTPYDSEKIRYLEDNIITGDNLQYDPLYYMGFMRRTSGNTKHKSITFTIADDKVKYIRARIGVYDSGATSENSYFTDIKLEEGNTATAWQPNIKEINKRNIIFNGITYEPVAIRSEGLEMSGDGKASSPSLAIANNINGVQGAVSAYCLNYKDFAGAKLTVINTLAKYLDPINFSEGNPTASDQYTKQIWYIEKKTSMNASQVVFELSNPRDFRGIRIPTREINNYCQWDYRGEACGYTGVAMYDKADNPTTNPELDQCSRRLQGCKIRFGEDKPLRFGGFPSSSLNG